MTPSISGRTESVRQTLPFPQAVPVRDAPAEEGVRQTLPFAKEADADRAQKPEWAEPEESFADNRASRAARPPERVAARQADEWTARRAESGTDAEPLATALSERFASLRQVKETAVATVFRGEEIASGRRVVIEVLSEAAASNSEQVELFYLEAEAAARLQHPRIVAAQAAEPFANTHLRVSEDAPGAETLRELLARRGWLEPTRAVRVIAQTAEALDYAHRIGVLHLNLQPENILIASGPVSGLDSSGEAIVRGFGIAADGHLDWARRGRAARCAPSYLSPEQAGGGAGDRSSDLYALGVLLYEALTDRVPFDSNDLDYLRHRHKIQSPQPPHNFNPDIPTELSNLAMALLARNPEARLLLFGDAAHFGATLRQACALDAAQTRDSARATNPMPLGEIVGELMASFGASDQALVATDPLAANARHWSRLWLRHWSRHWPWLTLLALALLCLAWLASASPGSLPRKDNRAEQAPSNPPPAAELIVRPGSAGSLTGAGEVDQTANATQQKREQNNHTSDPSNPPQSQPAASAPRAGIDNQSANAPPSVRPGEVAGAGSGLSARTGEASRPATPGSTPNEEPAAEADGFSYRTPVKRARPVYPAAARGAAGTVAVEVTIDEKGKVSQARAVSGPKRLRRAAEEAARRWRFAPGASKQTNSLILFNFQTTKKR